MEQSINKLLRFKSNIIQKDLGMSLSLEQIKKLRELGRLFEHGVAKPIHLQQLSHLLVLINNKQEQQNSDTPAFEQQFMSKY